MERIGVRELRNQASRVIRRARAGERLIVTVDGIPAAQIGPVTRSDRTDSLEELIATGAVQAVRVRTPPTPPAPVPAPSGAPSSEVLRQLRDR